MYIYVPLGVLFFLLTVFFLVTHIFHVFVALQLFLSSVEAVAPVCSVYPQSSEPLCAVMCQ